MRKLISIIFILALSGLAGCVTDAERAAEADADFKEERLKILKKYQDCAEEHQGDTTKLQSCDHYLKAIEAMK